MLCSGQWQPDKHGEYFIDRNPKVCLHGTNQWISQVFPLILDFLRTGKQINSSRLSEEQLERLAEDLDFYGLPQAGMVNSVPKPDSSGKQVSDLDYTVEISNLYKLAASQSTAEFLRDGMRPSGIALDAPAWIIFSFKKQQKIDHVEVLGFCGSREFSPLCGSGATILYSDDKIHWKDTGQQLPRLEEISKVDLKGLKCKYIRFDNKEYMGFSIVQFYKK